MVSENTALATPVLPAASVAVAVTEYVPSTSGDVSWIVYVPPATAPVPTKLPAMNSCTVAPASAAPANRGLAAFVIPSPTAPESSAAISAGAGGAAGAAVSIVKEKLELATLVLPAASVAVAVTA